MCTDAYENSDSSLILKKKRKKETNSRPYVALALLPECPSVLQNVCVVTCLHLVFALKLGQAPSKPSDLCLLFCCSFLCPIATSGAFGCPFSALSVMSSPFLSLPILVPGWKVPYPPTPPAPVCSVPLRSRPFKGKPPYGGWRGGSGT